VNCRTGGCCVQEFTQLGRWADDSLGIVQRGALIGLALVFLTSTLFLWNTQASSRSDEQVVRIPFAGKSQAASRSASPEAPALG